MILAIPHRYVIGAGVLLPAAGQLDEVRSDIERLLTLTQNRSRPLHWLNEGPVLRSAIIEMIGHLDLQVYAVIGSTPARHAIELVREECLREVFRSVREHEVERIVIESRERSTRVVGQNRRDFGTLIDARHAGDLSPSVAYEWVPKDEPLVWLADAVAGACPCVGARRSAVVEYDWPGGEDGRHPTSLLTRMSPGSHNHLAASLAPPRLYFTKLKAPRATSSMATSLGLAKVPSWQFR
jgi:hypothetical protein